MMYGPAALAVGLSLLQQAPQQTGAPAQAQSHLIADARAHGVGERWTPVYAVDGEAYFIDLATYREDGPRRSGWFYVHETTGSYWLWRAAVNCSNDTLTGSETMRFRYGEREPYDSFSSSSTVNVAPSTTGELVLRTLCDPYASFSRAAR